MYHYFYKITNNLNGHFYYGVHSTESLEDGYMGSGTRLRLAYKKYGIGNFSKEIIKFFETSDDAFAYEREIVNENLIKDPNCYNIQIGGKTFSTAGMVTVKDKDGNKFWITREEYIFGNYDTLWTGRHHKEESKEKMRKTLLEKTGGSGLRIWVNKEGLVKYIKKDCLDTYLSEGWKLGRSGYKPRKKCQGKKL